MYPFLKKSFSIVYVQFENHLKNLNYKLFLFLFGLGDFKTYEEYVAAAAACLAKSQEQFYANGSVQDMSALAYNTNVSSRNVSNSNSSSSGYNAMYAGYNHTSASSAGSYPPSNNYYMMAPPEAIRSDDKESSKV